MDPKQGNNDSDLNTLDAEEAALRTEAMEIDPARPEDDQIEDDTTIKQVDRSAEETAKKTNAAEKPAKETDAKDAAAEKTKTEDADKKAAEDESKLSPYEKERRRLNSSWKKLDEEKAAIRKEREQIEAARQQQTTRRAEAAKPKEKPTLKGYTADDYESAAEDFRKDGKTEEAALATKRAQELRAQEAEQAKQGGDSEAAGDFITLPTGARITPAEQQQMLGEWQANLKRLGDENPELTKDGTPLKTAVVSLLKDHPILHGHASGIHYAVEVAKLKLAASEVPTLKGRITELEALNKKLTELTSLSPTDGGGGSRRERPKPGESGNLDEDELSLREEAMGMDARGAG